jgi:hypothetical protein
MLVDVAKKADDYLRGQTTTRFNLPAAYLLDGEFSVAREGGKTRIFFNGDMKCGNKHGSIAAGGSDPVTLSAIKLVRDLTSETGYQANFGRFEEKIQLWIEGPVEQIEGEVDALRQACRKPDNERYQLV